MILEYSISLGTILQTVVYTAAAIAFFFTMRNDINIIKHDMDNLHQSQRSLNEAFSQLGKILTQVAVQDNRIVMIEKYVDELRHGQGFVK